MRFAALLAFVTALAVACPARAEPWSASSPEVVADVAAGKPFVVRVLVPLCSNEQIDCGSRRAGRAGEPATNLYWGAIFGARRIFERKGSGWERVAVEAGDGTTLERVVFRRSVPARRWGLDREQPVEQLVVLDAVHGAQIDRAVEAFWQLGTQGGSVSFADGDAQRSVRVHVAGYAGHNRLMDGLELPGAPAPENAPQPLRSFVLACDSEPYFGQKLRDAGSQPLVTTRSLMAPEGYVVEATVRALGDDESEAGVRARVVHAYAKWQRIPEKSAWAIFAGARAR